MANNILRVQSLSHLKELIKNNKNDFFIQLNFGLRSSKFIDLNEDGRFYVMNEIDGSEQRLTESEIMDEGYTNIGKALNLGALYLYN